MINIIDGSQDAQCELCGKVSELRPYGPNNEAICFACGMKDAATAARKFADLLDSADVTDQMTAGKIFWDFACRE